MAQEPYSTQPYSIQRDPTGYVILRDSRIVISYIDELSDALEIVNQLNQPQIDPLHKTLPCRSIWGFRRTHP